MLEGKACSRIVDVQWKMFLGGAAMKGSPGHGRISPSCPSWRRRHDSITPSCPTINPDSGISPGTAPWQSANRGTSGAQARVRHALTRHLRHPQLNLFPPPSRTLSDHQNPKVSHPGTSSHPTGAIPWNAWRVHSVPSLAHCSASLDELRGCTGAQPRASLCPLLILRQWLPSSLLQILPSPPSHTSMQNLSTVRITAMPLVLSLTVTHNHSQ